MGTADRKQPLLMIISLNQLEIMDEEFGEVSILFNRHTWTVTCCNASATDADLGDAIQKVCHTLKPED